MTDTIPYLVAMILAMALVLVTTHNHRLAAENDRLYLEIVKKCVEPRI